MGFFESLASDAEIFQKLCRFEFREVGFSWSCLRKCNRRDEDDEQQRQGKQVKRSAMTHEALGTCVSWRSTGTGKFFGAEQERFRELSRPTVICQSSPPPEGMPCLPSISCIGWPDRDNRR